MRRNKAMFRAIIILLIMPLLFTSGLSQAAEKITVSAAVNTAGTYSIVLASSPGKDLKWEQGNNALFKGRILYVEQTTIKGKTWERLNLGYFENREQADTKVKDLQKIWPGAWIQKTPASDSTKIISPTTQTVALSTTPVPVPAPAIPATRVKVTNLTDKQLDDLMLRAKTDFKQKNYASAIRYLKAIINAGEHKYSREALELLGLARQRNAQKAHAVEIYEKYLKLYPEGKASDRVRQRLTGLMTASLVSPEKIRMITEEKDEITSYGSLSQFYRNNSASNDDVSSLTTLSQLITFVDLTTLQRTKKFDHRYQVTADHGYNFIDDRDNSEVRFIETYYELSDRKTGSSGRIGRQSLRLGGTLKRFDGLSAGYQITPDMRINFLGGFPVDYGNKNTINTHKTFYGFTFESGTLNDNWDLNLFYFDQKVDGLTDRTSAGTDVRYTDGSKSLFGMIDYDLFFKAVNILQFNANIMFENRSAAYVNAFIRKAPLLSTSNALTGRLEKNLDELKKVMNIEQIYQLARDRTPNSQTLTVGGSQPLSERFQVSADLTLTRIGGTVASGGVAATEATGTDYFISTQLVGNNLFRARDTAVLGVRYYNTSLSSTTSLIANTRFPISSTWRLNPRLQFDFRHLSDGRSQNKLRAMLRTDYQYLSNVRFDFEIGYDETVEKNSTRSDSNNLFISMGYRWDF